MDGLALGVAAGVLATLILSLGTHVLRDFSYHQLERYCRERGRLDFYDEVVDRCERYALACEALRLVAIAVTAVAATVWALPGLFDIRAADAPRLAIFLGVATLTLLLTTLWLPVQLARHASAPILWATWRLWQGVAALAAPVLWTLDLFDFVGRRLAGQAEQDEEEIEEEALEEDIRSVVTAAARDGLLEDDTRDMIEGVLELDDVNVSAIMTRRSDVDALEVGTPLAEVVRFVHAAGRTRVPVYRETLDHIVGVLYAKDLIVYLDPAGPSRPEAFTLEAVVRPAWQVVQTKPIDELLREFRGTRSHLAIVVDEFESTVGIVSIEDVLEEIVGEIQDETDHHEEEGIVQVDDDVVVVPGDMHVEELNEELGLGLPEGDDYDSVGGLMTVRVGSIPATNQAITVGNVRLVAVQASARRVERVRVELLDGRTVRPEPERPAEPEPAVREPSARDAAPPAQAADVADGSGPARGRAG